VCHRLEDDRICGAVDAARVTISSMSPSSPLAIGRSTTIVSDGDKEPEDLKAFLANAPDVLPEPGDEIPDHLRAMVERAPARG
jgi:hypothetical protein